MKDLGATKNVEAAKFEGVWDELESKKCLQRQYLTEYLRVALVFVWGGTQRGGGWLISVFRGFCAGVGGGTGRWAFVLWIRALS